MYLRCLIHCLQRLFPDIYVVSHHMWIRITRKKIDTHSQSVFYFRTNFFVYFKAIYSKPNNWSYGLSSVIKYLWACVVRGASSIRYGSPRCPRDMSKSHIRFVRGKNRRGVARIILLIIRVAGGGSCLIAVTSPPGHFILIFINMISKDANGAFI